MTEVVVVLAVVVQVTIAPLHGSEEVKHLVAADAVRGVHQSPVAPAGQRVGGVGWHAAPGRDRQRRVGIAIGRPRSIAARRAVPACVTPVTGASRNVRGRRASRHNCADARISIAGRPSAPATAIKGAGASNRREADQRNQERASHRCHNGFVLLGGHLWLAFVEA